jgi:hypothetical protein
MARTILLFLLLWFAGFGTQCWVQHSTRQEKITVLKNLTKSGIIAVLVLVTMFMFVQLF